MRNSVRIGALAAALLSAAGIAGCRDIERHFGHAALMQPKQERAARPLRKTGSVVKRVTGPSIVQAGARIRGFCGNRHVRFHAGTLGETAQEKARNDVLCSQAY